MLIRIFGVALCACCMTFVGCDESAKDVGTDISNAADSAAEATGDAIEVAAEKTGEAIEVVKEKTADAAESVKDAVSK